MRNRQNIMKNKIPAMAALLILVAIWQFLCSSGIVPGYMLPSPAEVIKAFWTDRTLLAENAVITLQEAFAGMFFGVLTGFVFAVIMDNSEILYKAFYPILVITQTIPSVAIAPLLVLWFGYEMLPKVILVIIATFFPVTVGLLDGFRSADSDAVGMLRSMGASRFQIFRYIKFPSSLPQFFSGLRIAAAYSVVGAVISEWLGGFGGLGVYMTRVRKAFAFDKMFAVIFLTAIISLLLMGIVDIAERWCMPYRNIRENDK